MTCPVCHEPMPATALTTCTFWCGLVKLGRFTLSDVLPMLQENLQTMCQSCNSKKGARVHVS